MKTITELLSKYVSLGYSSPDARFLAAEEIIISKIAQSDLAERVTLKGGIVMYNLTKSSRRITKDIDFDFIKYSIDNESLMAFIDLLNKMPDGFKVATNGQIESLHQEDYQGARINVIIEDSKKRKLRFKLDIGVHTYHAIEQCNIVFSFDLKQKSVMLKANPPEQIVAEKLISLARFGSTSTRYKDVYDIYYLIKEGHVSKKKTSELLMLFLANSSKAPKDLDSLQIVIEETLNDKNFASEAEKPVYKWIDVSFEELKAVIIDFLSDL